MFPCSPARRVRVDAGPGRELRDRGPAGVHVGVHARVLSAAGVPQHQALPFLPEKTFPILGERGADGAQSLSALRQ